MQTVTEKDVGNYLLRVRLGTPLLRSPAPPTPVDGLMLRRNPEELEEDELVLVSGDTGLAPV
jgi:hypothetical protein